MSRDKNIHLKNISILVACESSDNKKIFLEFIFRCIKFCRNNIKEYKIVMATLHTFEKTYFYMTKRMFNNLKNCLKVPVSIYRSFKLI